MAVPQGRLPLRYTPGRWVAVTSASGGDAADGIALLADLDATSPVVTACWDSIDSGAGVDGVLGVILREGLRNVPSFAITARTGDGIRVLVSGKARAEVTGDGGAPVVLDAAAVPTWLERTLPGATGVRLLVPDAEPDVGPGAMLALLGGVVLAAVVEVGPLVGEQRGDRPAAAGPPAVSPTADTRTERPTPPPPPTPVAQPAQPRGDSGLIESLPWLARNQPVGESAQAQAQAAPVHNTASPPAAGGRRTGPIVLAVSCPSGHLGPPHAGVCRVCGAQVPQQDPFSVARPVLGTLHISTGAMVPLDRDVVLGRAPTAGDHGGAERQYRPHLVQLSSPGNDISRNHVRIGLEGWHVLVTDLGSTNGTVVTLPGQQPVRLRAHDAFTVVPGAVVNIADEVDVRFEGQT